MKKTLCPSSNSFILNILYNLNPILFPGTLYYFVLPHIKISDSIIMLFTYNNTLTHTFLMGSRLGVGHAALDRRAGVRILPPQPLCAVGDLLPKN